MTANGTPGRPAALWILLALLVVQGVGGIGGGLSLALAPDGSIMRMPVSYLDGSPFPDYLIPGLILLLVLGVLPLVVAGGLWMGRRWAWYGSVLVGCALMIWILVELTIVPFSWLQPAFGVVGVLIFAVTLLRSVRRRFGVTLPGEDHA